MDSGDGEGNSSGSEDDEVRCQSPQERKLDLKQRTVADSLTIRRIPATGAKKCKIADRFTRGDAMTERLTNANSAEQEQTQSDPPKEARSASTRKVTLLQKSPSPSRKDLHNPTLDNRA